MKKKSESKNWAILNPVDEVPKISTHKFHDIHQKLEDMKNSKKWLPVRCESNKQCKSIGKRFSNDGYKIKTRGNILYIFSGSGGNVLTIKRIRQKTKH